MDRATEHRTRGGIGYARAGAGDPMVLVHGWCCDRSFLAPQFTHLARGHTVVALDLRGHGASVVPAEPASRIGDFADDVADVIDDAGLTAPVVVGHSMGGLVALESAARGQASAAALLEPAPLLDEQGKTYFARSAPKVAADRDGAWRRRFAERIMLPTDRVRRAEIIAAMAAVDPGVAAAGMRAMAEYDAASALTAVRVPLLVVTDARPEDLTPVRDRCPSVVTGQTVGAGHFHQIEVPDQIDAMLDRFLAGL